MNNCGTCKHWSPYIGERGICDKIEMHHRITLDSTIPAGIEVKVLDDSGLEATLDTHESFGCTEWEGKV